MLLLALDILAEVGADDVDATGGDQHGGERRSRQRRSERDPVGRSERGASVFAERFGGPP